MNTYKRESTDKIYSIDYAEFLAHMIAADAEKSDSSSPELEVWICCYAQRDNVVAGTYEHATQTATLDLI
jgi:hypothetical protein